MTKEDLIRITLQALNAQLTGDFMAIKHQFSRCSSDEMQTLHESSGKTKQQIYDALKKQERDILKTITWVQSLRTTHDSKN